MIMATMVPFDRLHRFSQAILAVQFPVVYIMESSWLLNADYKQWQIVLHLKPLVLHLFFQPGGGEPSAQK